MLVDLAARIHHSQTCLDRLGMLVLDADPGLTFSVPESLKPARLAYPIGSPQDRLYDVRLTWPGEPDWRG